MKPKKGQITFYGNKDSWETFGALCKDKLSMKASRRLCEMIDEEIAKMQGKDSIGTTQEYSRLESQVLAATKSISELRGILEKREMISELDEFLQRIGGITPTTEGPQDPKEIETVLKKLHKYEINEDDHFSEDDLEILIQLMESYKQRLTLRRRLYKVRVRVYGKTDVATREENTAEMDLDRAAFQEVI